jgi:hypothetical protein
MSKSPDSGKIQAVLLPGNLPHFTTSAKIDQRRREAIKTPSQYL